MPTKRRFQAQQGTVVRDLHRIVTQMGATSLHVNQDLMEGTAEVVFDREGRRYVFRCRKYADPLDNLRAAQLSITYLWRALTEYGVESSEGGIPTEDFDRFFQGFLPPPDDSVLMLAAGKLDWWDVLGIERRQATAEAVRNAWRALARIHHPDAGGNAEEFRRLRDAYEAAIAEVGAPSHEARS